MRSTLTRSITALILVIAMAVGMTASLGGKAQAATPINIAYAAGDGATINGGPVYNLNAFVGVATTITTVKPTRSGYNFVGWTTTKNSGQLDFKSGQTVTFTKATTLWPVWNVNIAYAAGDGKFSNNSPVMNVSATVGKATTVPSSVPSRSGYKFIGWSEQKGATTATVFPGSSITYTKPTTYWPVWKALGQYRIIYHENGGQVGSMGSNGMTQPFTEGSSITLSPPNFYRSNYVLLGFSTSKTATSATYYSGKSYSFTTNTTLYAVWEPLPVRCTVLHYSGFKEGYDDANYQKENLREYLSGKYSKLSISSPIVNEKNFCDAWNSMPYNQSVVMIDCHTTPFLLAPGMVDINDIEQNKLANKNIKVIILIGCNAGHVDHCYPDDAHTQSKKNIAMAFAEKFKCVVYAADGNVQAFTLKCGKGDYPDYWALYNKYEYDESKKREEMVRQTPEGWFVYDGLNYAKTGTVERTKLHLGINNEGTTIADLLDAYYSKHYSW